MNAPPPLPSYPPPAGLARWQVSIVRGEGRMLDSQQLAERLSQGWELMGIQSGAYLGDPPVAYFKRRLP